MLVQIRNLLVLLVDVDFAVRIDENVHVIDLVNASKDLGVSRYLDRHRSTLSEGFWPALNGCIKRHCEDTVRKETDLGFGYCPADLHCESDCSLCPSSAFFSDIKPIASTSISPRNPVSSLCLNSCSYSSSARSFRI